MNFFPCILQFSTTCYTTFSFFLRLFPVFWQYAYLNTITKYVRPSMYLKSVFMYLRILGIGIVFCEYFKTHMQRRGLPHCWLNPRKL